MLFKLLGFAALVILLAAPSLSAAPRISEVSSAGQGILIDEDDDFPDWIELENPDNEAYSLTGHFLTDDPNDLVKWRFPSGVSIGPGRHKVFFASEKDRHNIFRDATHTNFNLPFSVGFLALVAPDGETIVASVTDWPAQRPGLSYGLGSDGELGYFIEPTPGAPNGEALPEIVRDTKFSVNRGFYDEPVSLTITSATEGAVIYFTTDGSEPSPHNGLVFEGPVAIDRTTIVRAAAYKDGLVPTNIDTHSYLYLASVLTQPEDPEGFPARWGSAPADYAFDTSVGTEEAFRHALLGYPSISLVMNQDSWFNPSRTGGEGGIYANSLARGLDWEKTISAEFINFEGSDDAQVDCGIRIYGNASRQTSRPKHNMRLAFRARYGPAKLDFPVFGKDKATGINGLLFNGQNGDSWFHPTLDQRNRASYIRDHFAHEVLGEMGHLSPPHARAHLYVNGLYWGFYQTVERVDQHFMARLLGGEPEDYDSMKASRAEGPTVVAGDEKAYEEMYEIANDGLTTSENYEALQQYLNLDQFIDYMLINFWSGNRDWDDNNWRAGRHRSEGSPYHFFMWDSENIFKDAGIDKSGTNNSDNPTRLHQRLSENSDYRLRFADRMQRHLFNGGILTQEKVIERWTRWAEYIRPGLVAESARWGDHHRRGNPHTVEEDFDEALADLLEDLFPARARNALRQLKMRGLYSEIQPVEFNQFGGSIESGFRLTMTVGSIFQPAPGEILYTLDGSDPTDDDSLTYERGGPGVALAETSTVKARLKDPDGQWSPLVEARFTIGERPQPGELLISEIHYHPGEPNETDNPDGIWSRTDYEYVELWNASDRALQLGGVALSEGVRFTFPERTLAPNSRVLVVEEKAAFISRYPSVSADFIAGKYRGQLSNGGEQLTLVNGVGEVLHGVAFDDSDPWPDEADGSGKSLVLRSAADPSAPASWVASATEGGTPGADDSAGSDGAFSQWLTANGKGAPLDRPNGVPNLIVYALGEDLVFNQPRVRLVRNADGRVAFSVWTRTGMESEITVLPERSRDLVQWEADPGDESVFIRETAVSTDGALTEIQWTSEATAEPSYFRLRVRLD